MLVWWEFRVGMVAVQDRVFEVAAALCGVFGVAAALGGAVAALGGVFGAAVVLGRQFGAAAVVFEGPATQDIATCGLLKC